MLTEVDSVITDLDSFLSSSDSSAKAQSAFIELMTSYREESRIELNLMLRFLLEGISYRDFLDMNRFLGTLSYIKPAEREILPELSDFLYRVNRYNLFSLALKVDSISVHFSLEKQALLLNLLEARLEKDKSTP